MEAPVSREWAVAAHLVQPPKQSVRQVPTPPQPNDTEAPPPIPAHLNGRECLYGYIVTDQLMERYRATHHPHEHSPNRYLRLAWNHTTIYEVARSSGLQVYIEHVEGRDDVAWFSYTKGGVVKAKQVPIASRLERFAKELGITDEPQWHDAWFAVQLPAHVAHGVQGGPGRALALVAHPIPDSLTLPLVPVPGLPLRIRRRRSAAATGLGFVCAAGFLCAGGGVRGHVTRYYLLLWIATMPSTRVPRLPSVPPTYPFLFVSLPFLSFLHPFPFRSLTLADMVRRQYTRRRWYRNKHNHHSAELEASLLRDMSD
ncbi:hypothetical protein B0H10DRAFT_2206646 [Mycena sp. CBHHK59/15]|nr:hypothetical protein B0H10DRAFT_2206646 [Mycena sp. CBHHK59/15]